MVVVTCSGSSVCNRMLSEVLPPSEMIFSNFSHGIGHLLELECVTHSGLGIEKGVRYIRDEP